MLAEDLQDARFLFQSLKGIQGDFDVFGLDSAFRFRLTRFNP